MVAIDPSDPDRVLAAVPYAGIFASDDGGRSFRSGEGGDLPSVNALAFDGTDPAQALAATCDGVDASDDGGDTWRRLPGEGLPVIRFDGD